MSRIWAAVHSPGLQVERGAQSISANMAKVSNRVDALGQFLIGRNAGNEDRAGDRFFATDVAASFLL
ncbi:hypothetical protein D3C84_394480 [compost metagenome]